MEYRVVIVSSRRKPSGSANMVTATEDLVTQVNAYLAAGWELQGGIASCRSPGDESYVFQAIVWRGKG